MGWLGPPLTVASRRSRHLIHFSFAGPLNFLPDGVWGPTEAKTSRAGWSNPALTAIFHFPMRLFRLKFTPALLMSAALAVAADKPNLLVIMADDLGYGDVSAYGATALHTPHIDRLAADGLRFTSGYCTASTCTPTRYSFLTGSYAFRRKGTGIAPPNGHLVVPPGALTIAGIAKVAGYRSAVIGKWHLGTKGFLPSDQGFDLALAGDEAGSTNNFFYPAWLKKVTLAGKPGDYLTDRLTTLAVEFIQSNKDREFFLYLPHFAVHTPIEGKSEKVKKYDAKTRPDDPQN